MNLKRLFSVLLCCSCLVFSGTFSSYADIATNSNADYVPTWQEAVEAVKTSRAAASASEADIRTLDLMDDDYGIMLMSSVGTVENTVDRTGVSIRVGYYAPGSSKVSWKDGYIKPNGEFELSLPDGSKLSAFELWFNRTALPPAGKYTFSADMSSHISFDWRECRFNGVKNVNNVAQNLVYKVINFNSSSGDVYIPPLNVDLGMVDFIAITLYPTEPMNDLISGSLRFRFQAYSGDQIDVITPGVGDVAQDYQAGVSSSLGSIGDTLEEIVETISLQLEALWNQMYNYIHLPEYEKLEQIRQAIENIRFDVDVDNQGVIDKLDEQIQNDNTNTQKVEEAVEKHGNFIIEGLKSLFIPDEEYFAGLFDRLNTFFSERLGFLYTPFDLLIRILQAFMAAGTENAGIPFPGIIVGEWRLLEPQTVTFDILDKFPGLQDKIYFATNTIMIGAFLALLSRKIKEVMSR